jgi:hypothetical protein
MEPLDCDAVWSDVDDWVSILEIHQMERCREIQSPRALDPGRIRCALRPHDHLLARLFGDEHERNICFGSRTDQCALKLSISKVVGDTKLDVDVLLLGVGPDTDYCTGRAEKLAFVFNICACEGIHRRYQ